MPRAGQLRHRFTLEAPNQGTGEITSIYTPVDDVWGSLEGLSGIESPAIQATADHRIRLRYRADVSPRHRLVLNGRYFTIRSVLDPDGRKRELSLLVEERV